MTGWAALSLAALASAWAAEPRADLRRYKVSAELRAALLRILPNLDRTETGRRLSAETREVPVSEHKDLEEHAVRYRRLPRPHIAVHPMRAAKMTDLDLEISLVRERTRAAADIGLDLYEDEIAAYQSEIAHAVGRAKEDPAFGSRLRAAYEAVRRTEETYPVLSASRSLAPGIQGLAWRLYLFSEDPGELDYAVEMSLPRERYVSVWEIATVVEEHGEELFSLRPRPKAKYVRLGDRNYPARVVRAALAVKTRAGLRRIREGLSPLRELERRELLAAVHEWIRGP